MDAVPTPVPTEVSTATVVRDTTTVETANGVARATTTVDTTMPPARVRWLSLHLRNILAILMMVGVLWLVMWEGNRDAIVAFVGAFSVLMGNIWGERAALKRPGADS